MQKFDKMNDLGIHIHNQVMGDIQKKNYQEIHDNMVFLYDDDTDFEDICQASLKDIYKKLIKLIFVSSDDNVVLTKELQLGEKYADIVLEKRDICTMIVHIITGINEWNIKEIKELDE